MPVSFARWRFALIPGLALAAASVAQLAQAQTQTRVEWRVENPFRFFTEPADADLHRATYQALTPEQQVMPVSAAERELAARHPDGWAASVVGQVCWDARRNRYACPDGGDYMNPDSHKVVLSLRGIDETDAVDCTWLTAPLGGRQPRGSAVTQPCDVPVSFAIPYPSGARVSVEVGGQPVAETVVKVTDLLIVGLGDSFASGEGNPDVPVRFSRERTADYGSGSAEGAYAGYPARVGDWKRIGDKPFIAENARWLDQACHRSLYSGQLRTALQLAVEDPHRAVTFAGFACSGAEVAEGLFLRYKGNEWVPNPPELSQISAAAEAQCGKNSAPPQDLPHAYHMQGRLPELKGGLILKKCPADLARKIDLLLVSTGGNDIGFSRLVANAVLSDGSLLRQLGGWFGQVHEIAEAEDELENLGSRYKALNRALHNLLHVPWQESDRIVLTAYPGLAVMEDGKSVCPDGRAGMDVVADFQLSAEKARQSSTVAEALNTIMRAAANEHGWTFVDRHRAQFLGRGICAGFSEAALSSADDLRLPRKAGKVWQPYNPADYRPYASRQRWFRTPNDAFLTGNFHATGSMLQKVIGRETVSWFQLLLASTYSGAFHPTAEGHAAIADAIVERARGVLAKYGAEARVR